MAGEEEGLSEVARDDFFWSADGGEVDARVPVKKKIEIGGDLVELSGGERSFEEGNEKFGDAGGEH